MVKKSTKTAAFALTAAALLMGATAWAAIMPTIRPTMRIPATRARTQAETRRAGGDKNVTITFQNIYPDPATPSYKMIMHWWSSTRRSIRISISSSTTLNTDQQKMKLKTQAASKEVPDITIVNPAAQMKPFVDAGLFAPLNDMLDQNGLKDTYQKGLLDYYSFDGNVYALPDGNNIEVVYYNKELFAQAGITASRQRRSKNSWTT